MAGYYNESDPAVIAILKWKSDGIAWLKYSYIMRLYKGKNYDITTVKI